MLNQVEDAYSPYSVWELPDDYLSRNAFDLAIKRLDMTSSPGYPFMKESPTNGSWLKWDGFRADPIQLDRLWFKVQVLLRNDPDYVLRAFIKQEPHKKVKAREGRWRLIVASSLDVQVLWSMMFGIHNDLEIENSYDLPSQQGFKMIGGSWKTYLKSWKSRNLVVGLDKSAWDWTAPYWLIKLELQLRKRLCRGRFVEEWFDLAERMYARMFENPIVILSDGRMFRQTIPGVMKSGCVNTISTNSHCQVLLHAFVCYDMGLPPEPWPVCCGDDTLQSADHTTDVTLYERYGVVVKSASDSVEFMGHEFTDNGPHPLYMPKHMKRLLYTRDEHLVEYFDAMARMYVHTRYFDIWNLLALKAGVKLPYSREYYLNWFDYEE